MSDEYKVKLNMFEGPLDLLLHLIRKNEVDIFDIPIAIITDQYLEYMDLLKSLNIDIAGDFLVMASTLTHIKSRMLLPELTENEEEGEDPRNEITEPLLEYIRLKELAGELFEREILNRDVFTRKVPPDSLDHLKSDEILLDVNLFQLIDAFKKVIERELPGSKITFKAQIWSIKERTAFIMTRLKKEQSLYFHELFRDDRTIAEFIITFLALLELVHMGLIRLYQPDPYKDIRLEAHFTDDEDECNGEIP
ncbi:MAG: segregation/condensation protein A [Deltaproteobacteria bacterium]|nr:segregation/condensation protein A [Deltaproteobacteria bacterium]